MPDATTSGADLYENYIADTIFSYIDCMHPAETEKIVICEMMSNSLVGKKGLGVPSCFSNDRIGTFRVKIRTQRVPLRFNFPLVL